MKIAMEIEAAQVQNAGGRAFDAIRTLSVLQAIGNPGTIVVIHHTDCGMTHFHNNDIRKALVEQNPTSKGFVESMELGEITDGIEKSIRDIVALKKSPLIKQHTNIIGLAYDTDTGLLSEVLERESGI
ncbi:carbonate dehydratase [Exophiala aquamarina CBS 119918]|uniref:Carbonate dehydratase n=1 Tax=Exophiala aquamarina CBS 119918 TaxID=1182545 RepID=A0A072NY30_9EURO|nr:carbonate dehydratase [Exophiala aquamarina CBS 119918]KEF52302.1 carbonate dehydratase [Exophiala aquamarina CBS 119918]